jgi:radical SAM superfamily enzyme YgiQ (UPF0313 family)
MLRQPPVRLVMINLNHPDRPPDEAFKDIDVVLTGGLCTHYREAKELVKMVREGWPDTHIVVGGGLFSGTPDLMHDMLKPDVGVIGEGEGCIAEVLNDIERGDHAKTYTAAPIQDLSTIPRPDYDILGVRRYLSMQHPNGHYYTAPCDKPRALAVVASRGCPFDCSFCYHPLGKGYRQREPEDFLSEVEDLISKYDLNILCILDEVLGWKRDRLDEILKGLKSFGIHWMCQMRVDQVDKDLLGQMKDSGCYYISYGVESADNRVLKAMKKHTTIEQVEDALWETWQAKMGIQGNILIGDPADTMESILNSILWWFRYRHYTLNAIRLIPYPASPAWKKLHDEGKIDTRKFIENGCKAGDIPLSTICDAPDWFEELVKQLTFQLAAASIPVVPPKTTHQHTHPKQNVSSYIVEATCPWCKSEEKQKNFILGETNFTRMIWKDEFEAHGGELRSGFLEWKEKE